MAGNYLVRHNTSFSNSRTPCFCQVQKGSPASEAAKQTGLETRFAFCGIHQFEACTPPTQIENIP